MHELRRKSVEYLIEECEISNVPWLIYGIVDNMPQACVDKWNGRKTSGFALGQLNKISPVRHIGVPKGAVLARTYTPRIFGVKNGGHLPGSWNS